MDIVIASYKKDMWKARLQGIGIGLGVGATVLIIYIILNR